MIAGEALQEALWGLLSDRALAVGALNNNEEDVKDLDKTINEIQKTRMEELHGMSSKERKEIAERHLDYYEKHKEFFPESKDSAPPSEIIINSALVFTDLYVYEVEFGNESRDEIDDFLLKNKIWTDATINYLGGPMNCFEAFQILDKYTHQN